MVSKDAGITPEKQALMLANHTASQVANLNSDPDYDPNLDLSLTLTLIANHTIL